MTPIIDTIEDIEKLPVLIYYVGPTTKNGWGDKKRPVDRWDATITGLGNTAKFSYYTGTGLRVLDQPVKPRIAEVLHALVMDAEAGETTFESWCGDYGFSDDSIKALKTYEQCVETSTKLRGVFPLGTIEQIRELTAEL